MQWPEKRSLLKEPLLHFLLIGAALFLLEGWRGNAVLVAGGQAAIPSAQVVVTQDDIAQMHTQFERTWQRPPTEEEQKSLVEDFVRSEVFYREAVVAGLDRNDEVLKRRLRQKMEFIYEDISSLAEPTDADLRAFMEKHRERYLSDPQRAFRQAFFSIAKRGAGAEAEAREALAQLSAGAEPDTVGDPTLLETEVPLAPLWDIRREFGDAFARLLLEVPPGKWSGPLRSGFGLHLVFVRESQNGRLPDLDEARETVKRDWTAERQKELKDAAYARVRERYTVTVERPQAAAAPLAAAASAKAVTR